MPEIRHQKDPNKTQEFESTVPRVNFHLGYCHFFDVLQMLFFLEYLVKKTA